jgi:hypothetical protein
MGGAIFNHNGSVRLQNSTSRSEHAGDREGEAVMWHPFRYRPGLRA